MSLPLVLLGAGASAPAYIPTAYEMTREVIKRLELNSRFSEECKLLYFVVGGLLFNRGIRGENPLPGIDIEELFAAVDMLAKRQKLEIAPFVGHWHPVIAELEKPHVDYYWNFHNLRNSFGKLVGELEKEKRRRSPAEPHASASDFVRELEKVFDVISSPPERRIFESTQKVMIEKLRDIVWIEDRSRVEYLDPLVSQGKEKPFTIATLNYDNTIELACETFGVSRCTGIEAWSQSGEFRKPAQGIELLKLHGSINWPRFKPTQPSREIPLPHTLVREEEIFTWENGQKRRKEYDPAIVFGAGNKLTAEGPFLELFRAFQQRLEDSQLLLAIGCSFRDVHIYEAIAKWVKKSTERRIIVIDKEGGQSSDNLLDRNYGGAMGNRLEVRNVGAAKGIAEFFQSERLSRLDKNEQ